MSNGNVSLQNTPDEEARSCDVRITSAAANELPEYENDLDLAMAASKESLLSLIGDDDLMK